MTGVPGLTFTDHTVTVPLDHRRRAARPIEVFAREVVAADRAGDRSALAAVPAGRPGRQVAAARRGARRLARAGRADPPGAAARPARHRPQHPDHRAYRRRPAGRAAGRVPAAVPGGQHRRRRRVSCASGSPAAQPWDTLGQSYGGFVTLTYLSPAPRGSAHLLRHRRAARAHRHGRRGVRAHLPAGRRPRTPSSTARYPDDVGAGPPDRRPPRRARTCGCPTATG